MIDHVDFPSIFWGGVSGFFLGLGVIEINLIYGAIGGLVGLSVVDVNIVKIRNGIKEGHKIDVETKRIEDEFEEDED